MNEDGAISAADHPDLEQVAGDSGVEKRLKAPP
jgi:hypothetical protein